MKRRRLLLAIPSGKIPKEFLIFSDGTNETTKGPVVWNASAAESVFAREEDIGRDLVPFDYGHGQIGFIQTLETAKAGGWFKLARRGKDLWATEVDFTPAATKALTDREFRFFSPAVFVDTKTHEVREFTNIALTNLPATKNQEPLIASDTPQPAAAPTTPETTSMDEKTLIKLFVALGVSDAGEILGKVISLAKERQQLFDAVKEIQAKLSTADAELTEFRKTKGDVDKTALIETLSVAGKLPPALKKWAAGQSLETIQSFSTDAPISSVTTTTVTPQTPDTKKITLTLDEKKIAEILGVTDEDYLKTKADLSSQEQFWHIDPAKGMKPAAKGSN